MDNQQIGQLIRSLRIEKNMTQLQLADKLGVTDKAVSKWERGLGSPDISLIANISRILDVDIDNMLSGDLQPSQLDIGNLKRTQFYVCPSCGSLQTSTSDAEISCCGRKLTAAKPQKPDAAHTLQIEPLDGEYFLSSAHPMTKSHYISFMAYITQNRILLVKLYPEQAIEIYLPKMRGGTLVYYCTEHGLMETKLP